MNHLTSFKQPAVRRYLNDIGRHPLMTAAEEIDCGKLVQEAAALKELDRPLTTDEKRIMKRAERAKKRFIEANLRMVVSIAKRYAGGLQSVEILDLIQEGSFGLIRAVDLYDPTRGYKFSTYAYWWIRQAMTRAIGQKDPMIRLPQNYTEKVYQMRKIIREESQRLGRTPNRKEIAQLMKISVQELDDLVNRSAPAMSLNVMVGDCDHSLLDVIPDPSCISQWEEAMQMEMALRQEMLSKCIEQLNDRDRDLICLRYGLNGNQETTYAKLGEKYGISRERIRQLLDRAERKLKLELNRQLQEPAENQKYAKLSEARMVPDVKNFGLEAPLFLPPAIPESLPLRERKAIWSAPVLPRTESPCAVSTAA